MQVWIWTHLLLEHSRKQECVCCGDSSALAICTKQCHGIVSLQKHRSRIQRLEDGSQRTVCWTVAGWRSLPGGYPWLSARSCSAAVNDSRCVGVKQIFSQHPFWLLLLLPRLRKGMTSAENGDNEMLHAKRECRVRAAMDGKWCQQPEITRVVGGTGSSSGSQLSSANGNACFNFWQRYLAFPALSVWFAK